MGLVSLGAPAVEASGFGPEIRGGAVDLGYSMMPRLMGDVDGDGRADYCRFVGARNAAYFSCALAASNFTGYSYNGYTDPRYYTPDNGAFAQLADVTGDGKADLCTARVWGNFVTVVCFSNPHDNGTWSRLGGETFEAVVAGMPMVFADANADGRADFCRFRSYYNGGPAWPVCEYFGGYYFNGGRLEDGVPLDLGYSWGPRYFADANGDRRVDYCRAVGNSPYIFLSCATGTGFGSNQYAFNSPAPFDFGYSWAPRLAGDVVGWGWEGFCRFVGDSRWPSLSCWWPVWNLQYGTMSAAGIDRGYGDLPRFMVDVSADGLEDFCRFVGPSNQPVLGCALSWVYTW